MDWVSSLVWGIPLGIIGVVAGHLYSRWAYPPMDFTEDQDLQ